MKSLPVPVEGPIGTTDPIRTIELELLTLARNLETLGRRSSLYRQVDRSGYVALRTLDRIGPVPTTALAEALALDASTVTRQVAALERSGLVERRPNPTDRRSSNLSITPHGRRVMQEVERARRNVLGELFDEWSEADREGLGRALTHLNLSLGDRVTALCAAPEPEGGP